MYDIREYLYWRIDEAEAVFQREKENLKSQLPPSGKIKYLEEKLKEFGVQPWPFIISLAHHNGELFTKALNNYLDIEKGGTKHKVIIEKMVQYQTTNDLLLELKTKLKLV